MTKNIKENDVLLGYKVKRVEKLELINSSFFELEHINTGAKYIHIANDDKENTFAVAFKTVPFDSTGVAHILEHTALCGSKNFPVRDPFFSMIKRSLNTFMNAFTASDWTMYPFSTQNKKDYYNLMAVYLDSAFFPLLNELNFKQEGYRIEVDGDELVYKGVVYNEMKGAMSSPNQVMMRTLLQAMYPDNTYGYNSGGEPKNIPDLTYDQFKKFHQRFYHPSNSFFYTYGNFDLEDNLKFISQNVLEKFNQIDPKTEVNNQPRWKKPKTCEYPYPISKNEDIKKKSQICLSWLLTDIRDSFDLLSLTLLEQILLSNAASPLRKALMESEIGASLSDGTGFESELKDTMFSCGLKDVEKTSGKKIEKIIFDVFKNLVKNKIDKELIDSAIHQLEFHRKEITNTPYPYGLKLIVYFIAPWLHGGDPITVLHFDDDLNRINNELKKGPFFENLIKKYFLDNKSRILFSLVPDPDMSKRQDDEIKKRLKKIKETLSKKDIEQIKKDSKSLLKLQDQDEDISVLPTLSLKDVPADIIKVAESDIKSKMPVTTYIANTSDIFYFTMASGVGHLNKKLLPLVPFFCFVISKIGTKKHSYDEIARLIDKYMGGFGFASSARSLYDSKGHCMPYITVGAKLLNRNMKNSFEIISEILQEFAFTDLTRLKIFLMQYKTGLESSIVQSGHGYAMMLSSRNYSKVCSLSEIWNGIHQFETIKALTEDLNDEKLNKLAKDLDSIGKQILNKNNIKFALIGDKASVSQSLEQANNMYNGLKQDPANGFIEPDVLVENKKIKEGWYTSSAVSFVASTFKTVRKEHVDAPVLSVIASLLKFLYIHKQVREKGGAYGGYAMYNSEDGVFNFSSYRDPHIVSTLNAYENAYSFINSEKNYTDEDIKEAILQVCSKIDKPNPPGPSARQAFYRKLVHLTDDLRQVYKERLLAIDKNKVKEIAEKYFSKGFKNNNVAIVSNEEKLKQANEKLKDNSLKLFKI